MNRSIIAIVAAVMGCAGDAPDEERPYPSLPNADCLRVPGLSYRSAANFGSAEPGTLAGWNPDGRWFITETPVGGSTSVHFRRTGSQIQLDRNPASSGSLTDTELFARVEAVDGSGNLRTTALRVSNLAPDGSARIQRALCFNGECDVCTAKLVRATRLAGEGEGQGLTLLSELAGPNWGPGITYNVRVAGTLAYVIRTDGLHIIETADPARPVELGQFRNNDNMGYANDLKLVDAGDRRYALIADTPIDVIDVTDPTAPRLAAQIAESAHTLFTETREGKTWAYLGAYDGSCPVYDVTDPTRPERLGRFDAGASLVHDLSVADGIAYLNAWNKGFLMVDFTTPASPRLVGSWAETPIGTSHSNWTTTAGGRKIALHGDEGYGAHLSIVDVDPASSSFMQPIAAWETRPWISIHNLMAFGEKAYFTHYQDGVRVLSLADPTRPTQVGYYNTWDPQSERATSAFFESAIGLDVDLARKLIFVADSPRGLMILRDDTP